MGCVAKTRGTRANFNYRRKEKRMRATPDMPNAKKSETAASAASLLRAVREARAKHGLTPANANAVLG